MRKAPNNYLKKTSMIVSKTLKPVSFLIIEPTIHKVNYVNQADHQ